MYNRFKLEYHSAENVVVNLTNFPFYWNETDFRDYNWEFEAVKKPIGYGSKFTKITKGTTTKSIKLLVRDTTNDIYDLIDELSEVFEKDIINGTLGKLYVNDYYIKGYVTSFATTNRIKHELNEVEFSFTTEYPFWIKENTITLPCYEGATESGFSFPFHFPFGFIAQFGSVAIDTNHYVPSASIIRFYGPATNPIVSIGTHIYQVLTTIGVSERIEVNQVERTIKKITASGDEVNVFRFRNKESSIFEYIPAGQNIAFYNGEYPIELVLFEERSMPKWN